MRLFWITVAKQKFASASLKGLTPAGVRKGSVDSAERMDGWMDRWIDGRMNEWISKWMNNSICSGFIFSLRDLGQKKELNVWFGIL